MTSPAQLSSIQVSRVLPLEVERAAGDVLKVVSGIRKRVVSSLAAPAPVEVQRLGLAGDEQADPEVHGGLEKAVYAYPAAHYAFWRQWLGRDSLPPGSLGENLLIDGLTEAELWIGDRLQIGECWFSVTAPRRPCYKLNAVLGNPGTGREMLRRGLTGWYLSVDHPGCIAAGMAVQVHAGPRQVALPERVRQMTRPADLA